MSEVDAVAVVLRAFVGELVASGVREAVVCPGSRSTPIALALRADERIRVRVLIDERSAGFFALGIAKTARRPVVLAATSGTAVAEFLPAVVEASLGRVPLVVLTADRPPELRDRGAPQTIDQVRLYGTHAKWFAELPLIDDAPDTLAHWLSVAGRAVATAIAGPAGPVHLDLPFREPLVPVGDLRPRLRSAARADAADATDVTDATDATDVADAIDATDAGAARPFTAAIEGRRRLDPDAIAMLADRLAAHPRGLIVAGPDDDPDLPAALATLARAAGYPIVADPLSGLRAGRHDRSSVVVRGDLLARPGAWIDAHRPTLVLRTGAMPTSKPMLELLRAGEPELLVLDGAGGWREPALVAATFVHADAPATATDLAAALNDRTHIRDDAWPRSWLAADTAAAAAMADWLGALDEPFEGAPFPALAALLPDDGVLWAGSSMPVRDLDAWLPSTERTIRVLANRGANGIDGVLSSALGSAAVSPGPVALVIGDLSFLHDLGGLVTARLHDLSLTVVLVDNDGGGIFSFLPQAAADAPGVGLPAHFEELFGTPHGIDAGPVVEALGGQVRQVNGTTLAPALEAALGRPGLDVLHLRTDRSRNVVLHRAAAGAVRAALDRIAFDRDAASDDGALA